jgi:ADP-heptose:LPS heptosyltransferase
MRRDQSVDSILVYVGSNPDDAIGENILKLPFLRSIREAFPKAEITWIAGYGPCMFQGILEPLVDGYIDELITDFYIDGGPSELVRHWHPLKRRRFDLVFDTQRNVIRTLVLRRVRHRIFISGCWRFFFSDRKAPSDCRQQTLLTDKLLSLTAAAANQSIRPSHIWPLEEQWKKAAATLLPDGADYVGLAPGAGNKETGKCWPLDQFVALARAQQAKGRIPVLFVGPDEEPWLPELRRQLPNAKFPEWDRDGVPATVKGPPLAMALAARLRVAVANCSGIGHILAAGGAPMVSLYGPTRPTSFAPYTPTLTTLWARDFDPSGRIDAIPAETVAAALEERFLDTA